MLEPVVFEAMPQKNSGDCAVVCLCMLLGRPYAEVFAACPKRGRPEWNGLSNRQIQNVAARLGHQLNYFDVTKHRAWLDDNAGVGILDLDHDKHEGHYVMWSKGTIYNPAQNEHWTDLDAFLARRANEGRYSVAGLLWRVK